MIEPTEAHAAALALPGDDWPAARRRARRLLNAVRECRPCALCAPGGPMFDGLIGWIDDDKPECRYCAGYRDSIEQWHAENDGAASDHQ